MMKVELEQDIRHNAILKEDEQILNFTVSDCREDRFMVFQVTIPNNSGIIGTLFHMKMTIEAALTQYERSLHG